MIRPVKPSDAKAIARIYNHYITHSIATFELDPVKVDEMEKRIKDIHPKYPYLVYVDKQEVVAYAYACPWKARKAYQHSVESSVYLHPEVQGKGIGSKLYSVLIDKLKAKNIHAVIGGISLPNEASVALHEKFEFKKIGQFAQVGRKFNQWIDVGYWELILDD